ncbi:hypothetical protein N7492_002703 [Penicillium capsulatum]|uniref:C2H2 finger domain protein n=1 Tax=Penicillium capsulatum TaxID=69766 RepID=A0A9W9IJV0_9EURO|nr:hypothetical protein N7492_002703 [Penicillium capsulatum]KAJ6122701.1 hypothetical protein N7512_005166 [Penicillium capsulatum]
MGKKRRGPSLEEILARPWCYYCERDFDDLKILTLHQKAKHFKCERCGRRLNTAGGLSVHMGQVHKEQLTEIENALPNRSGLDVEIFGMEGIPDDVLNSHNQRVATQFHQAEAERQAATGNPPAGSGGSSQPAKKPKLEDTSDLKKRLAEHRAKRAEAATGASSGEGTPVSATGQSIGTPGVYGQPPAAAPAPAPAPAQQQYSYPQPYGGAAAVPPYQQTASPGYQPFSPAPGQPAPAYYQPPIGYSPQAFPGQPSAPGYGATPPFPQQHTPTESSLPPRPGSLPTPTGLPQRPAFGAPPVNAQQMQQMHMGQSIPGHANGDATKEPNQNPLSTDESAAKAPEASEKPSKKEKSKPTRMIYSDDTTSPEEKMAKLPRYAFTRNLLAHETVVGEVPDASVTGAIRDSDTVIDPAH